jgi:hypothetical protein
MVITGHGMKLPVSGRTKDLRQNSMRLRHWGRMLSIFQSPLITVYYIDSGAIIPLFVPRRIGVGHLWDACFPGMVQLEVRTDKSF